MAQAWGDNYNYCIYDLKYQQESANYLSCYLHGEEFVTLVMFLSSHTYAHEITKIAHIMEVKIPKLASEDNLKPLDRVLKIERLTIVTCYYGV